MLTTGWLIAVALLLPLLAGVVCFLVDNRSLRRAVVLVTAALLSVDSLLLMRGGPTQYTPPPLSEGLGWGQIIAAADFILLLGFLYIGWQRRSVLVAGLTLVQLVPLAYFELVLGAHAEVEPAFVVDWLAIIMVLVISIVGSLICVYALRYLDVHEHHLHLEKSRQPRFFLFLVGFLGVMNGLVLSNSLLWVYFFWEVTTLCSYMLISHDGTAEAIANGVRAAWMNLIGGVAFVAAIYLLYLQAGTLSLADVVGGKAPAAGVLLPVAFLCFAGMTKSAQMPFQSWLLGAMVAPTPVSALLHSSTMVKAGVYLILRLAPAYLGTDLSVLISLAGGFTFVATALLAVTQSNAKRVLAYSTISNLGLIILCAGINTPLAIAAAVVLIIFHAVSKGLLFLAVGSIEQEIGSRDLEDMEGLLGRMPVTSLVVLIGILSMMLPPFGMLIGKWAAMEASVRFPVVALLVVLGSAVTVVFWTKWIGRLLSLLPSASSLRPEAISPLYAIPLLGLAAGDVLLSGFIGLLLDSVLAPAVTSTHRAPGLVVQGWLLSSGAGAFPWWPLFIVFALAVLLPLWLIRVRPEEVRAPYLCGVQEDDYEHVAAFRSVGDAPHELKIGGYYFRQLLSEQSFTGWANPMAIALIVILFGVVYL